VEATSDLVLVRASQLTCRKGWDKDFWEPIARNGRTVDRISRGVQLGPVPPASPEDIDAIIKAGRVSDEERAAVAGTVEEDRVVGAAPSPLTHVPKSLITKHLPPAPEQAQTERDTHEGPNSREKILIAKEEVARKRISNRIRPSVEPLPSTSVLPASPINAVPESAEPIEARPVEPETVPENVIETVADNTTIVDGGRPRYEEVRQPLPFDVGSSQSEWHDEPLVPAIPPTFDHWNYPADRHPPFLWLVQGVSSGRTDDVARVSDITPTPVEGEADVVAQNNVNIDDQPFELPPPVDTTFHPPVRPEREKPRSRRQRQVHTFRTRWTDTREHPRRRESAPEPTWVDAPNWTDEAVWLEESERTPESVPVDTVLPALMEREAGIPLVHVEELLLTPAVIETPSEWADADDSGWMEPFAATAPDIRLDSGAGLDVQAHTVTWAIQEDPYESGYDDVVVSGNGIGPILYDPEIDDYVVAPEVPRMCRTCAAFRPAEDGERGWCSNGWAFNNRLLVSAWDVPCQTSFGNWWIPNDDNWNDGVFDRLHAPAPLFDLLMAQKTPPRREKPNARKRWS